MSRLASFKKQLVELLSAKVDVADVNVADDSEVLDKVHEAIHGYPPVHEAVDAVEDPYSMT